MMAIGDPPSTRLLAPGVFLPRIPFFYLKRDRFTVQLERVKGGEGIGEGVAALLLLGKVKG